VAGIGNSSRILFLSYAPFIIAFSKADCLDDGKTSRLNDLHLTVLSIKS